ncbi:hypothetical protein VTN02DRAFT_2038 [Thermoascus thermophilus]
MVLLKLQHSITTQLSHRLSCNSRNSVLNLGIIKITSHLERTVLWISIGKRLCLLRVSQWLSGIRWLNIFHSQVQCHRKCLMAFSADIYGFKDVESF